MTTIHSTALVSPGAQIDPSVSIGPNVIVGEHVRIGPDTRVYANACITGYTDIGPGNEIHFGAIIGHDPQDLSFDPSVRSYVRIGAGNVIREYCTIHRGTTAESVTEIGSNTFLMANTHVAHNVTVGDGVITANCVAFGGHVRVGPRAFISGGAMFHQFCSVGRLAMVSGLARISCDVPPFVMALERNEVQGVNLVGMRRAGVAREAIREIKAAYGLFYNAGLTGRRALEALEEAGFATPEAGEFIAFIKEARRPLVRHRERH